MEDIEGNIKRYKDNLRKRLIREGEINYLKKYDKGVNDFMTEIFFNTNVKIYFYLDYELQIKPKYYKYALEQIDTEYFLWGVSKKIINDIDLMVKFFNINSGIILGSTHLFNEETYIEKMSKSKTFKKVLKYAEKNQFDNEDMNNHLLTLEKLINNYDRQKELIDILNEKNIIYKKKKI